MENSGTGIQLNPPLQPAATTASSVAHQTDSYSAANHHHLYSYGDPNYQFYYSQSQNPNPFSDPHYYANSAQIQPPPPGIDVRPLAMIPPPNYYVSSSGYEAATQLGTDYSSAQTTAGVHPAVDPTFYQDANQTVSASSGVNLPAFGVMGLQNATISKRTKTLKKPPKKIKIVQSVWCEVCKVDCNTKNVLDQHKLGKKHKKNLQKLIQLANPQVVSPSPVSGPLHPPASTVADKPVIGPAENPLKGNSSSSQTATNEAAAAGDLEIKRKKMLEGGAAADSVRMCAICNVVCNSETVFATHLAGQKHAAKLKKHANATKAAVHT
ncbi:OLC1v1009708C1 [Oldenlandia corymbosa var. corymbosa]|uniref:OLC1v1009708C1 n=1 Tax=Oldenlandia corymbosa var. corymbosa TaxID=529605 RepID=A0AAV1DQ39_OLDCO|nr:OLC1v1009708C1 [Oldenlandia corymbosa var. corymbosa]